MADFTPEALRRWKRKQEKALDKITADAFSDIKKVQEDFIARLEARLGKVRVHEDELANNAEKLRLIRDIRAIFGESLGLREDGTYKALDDYRRLQRRAEALALEYFAEFGEPVTYGRASRQMLNILFTEQHEGLLEIYDERLRRPTIRAVRAETLGVGTREAFIAAIAETGVDLSVAQIERAIDDGVRQVNRAASVAAASENGMLDVAIWEGPQDGKTSEQCQAMFDEAPYGPEGVWLVSDISPSMVAGLTGDPQFEGGHPGCRHDFTFVDRSYAEDYLGAVFDDEG